jgi:hypothetical protein
MFFYRTYNKNLSVNDIKNTTKRIPFSFLVVEAKDLYYGFDLSKAEEYEIAVKMVTHSYSVICKDGENVDAIVGGWKITRILPTWIKDSNSWNQIVDDYVVEKEVDKEEEEELEEEAEEKEEEEEEEEEEEGGGD